jgi:lipoyl(octanoyl) transferase 2
MVSTPTIARTAVKLQHIHIPSRITYSTSLRLQEALLGQHWAHRASLKEGVENTSSNPHTSSPPSPYFLTFSTQPTYTVGRRHLESNPLSEAQINYLTRNGKAAGFHASSRGGLLTYHGPGQLTAYPIIDLRRWGLSARCYVRLLENAVIRTCNALLGKGAAAIGQDRDKKRLTGRSPTDPGVWMLGDDGVEVTERKICALGVQITRGVGWHGIGLNVYDAPIEANKRAAFSFDDQLPAESHADRQRLSLDRDVDDRGYLSWGFGRIVACGLEGKSTTWLAREGASIAPAGLAEVGEMLAEEVVAGLNIMRKTSQIVDGVDHTMLKPRQHAVMNQDTNDLVGRLSAAIS